MNNNNKLNVIYRLLTIGVILVGVITYVSGVHTMACANADIIEEHSIAIEQNKNNTQEIDLKLAEIETHLIYIRKALDE